MVGDMWFFVAGALSAGLIGARVRARARRKERQDYFSDLARELKCAALALQTYEYPKNADLMFWGGMCLVRIPGTRFGTYWPEFKRGTMRDKENRVFVSFELFESRESREPRESRGYRVEVDVDVKGRAMGFKIANIADGLEWEDLEIEMRRL